MKHSGRTTSLIRPYPHLHGKGTVILAFPEEGARLLLGHRPYDGSFFTIQLHRIELILGLRIGSQNHLRIGHCRTRAVSDAAGDRACVHTEALFLVRAQCHQLSGGTGTAILIGRQTILIVLSRSGRVVVIHIRRIGALHRVDRLVVFVGGAPPHIVWRPNPPDSPARPISRCWHTYPSTP